MARITPNYNLTVPDSSDFADITPIGKNMETIDAALAKKADVDESGMVPKDQIPALEYVATTEKGKANGVASLDVKGRVPKSQLPTAWLQPQIIVTNAADADVTATGDAGVIAGVGDGTKTLGLPDYGSWVITAAKSDREAVPKTVLVDTVKQYQTVLTWFTATISVVAPANATVIATSGNHQYSATADAKGKAELVVRYGGTYEVAYYTGSVGCTPVSVTVVHGQTHSVNLVSMNRE